MSSANSAPVGPDAPRVVITACGAVTNLGHNARDTWAGMREGRSGITMIEGDDFARYSASWEIRIGGQVKGWDPVAVIDGREQRRLDRFTQLGLYAAAEAAAASGIDWNAGDFERRGVIVGSGIGGIRTIEEGHNVIRDKGPERTSPFTVPRLMPNAAAGNIAIRYNLQGPASTHATACASSGHAFADAVHTMRRGEADVMIVGGAEGACSPICLAAFSSMKALSKRNDDPTRASRPFDQGRDGFVLAEGAAAFVLETEAHARARGAQILAEIVGVANSCDAHHITAPHERGLGAARSMRWALRDARLAAEDIGYVNAHGTSTDLGDSAEVRAVLDVFGALARRSAGGRLMMSSTKSMMGHSLGASGAIETIACIHAVREGVISPTINLEKPDDDFDIDLVPGHARERRVRYAMNNTFGFGGHNCTIIIGRYQ
ncbi:MAG: beta-ketoacyl-[acyl-carrier-protein] synthase II [Planctomyces sp.]|nr:beta-ketoacyl-[acyl-carrier-protein] synthase II [Planctomyces sp.]MBA4038993.1 beta-ketoacyl-[acyl-carrier-protein] synthase II [Planctomyces sp.]MBA4120240.1 beta-ketoacyl-[acyl-carrier-protein] synthase II [Isosphaera sp.]